jgi:hypothetical protein
MLGAVAVASVGISFKYLSNCFSISTVPRIVQLHRHFAIPHHCKFITILDAISRGAFVLANPAGG